MSFQVSFTFLPEPRAVTNASCQQFYPVTIRPAWSWIQLKNAKVKKFAQPTLDGGVFGVRSLIPLSEYWSKASVEKPENAEVDVVLVKLCNGASLISRSMASCSLPCCMDLSGLETAGFGTPSLLTCVCASSGFSAKFFSIERDVSNIWTAYSRNSARSLLTLSVHRYSPRRMR